MNMTKKQKKVFWRILLTIPLIIIVSFLPFEGWIKGTLYMIPYLLIGYDILKKAVRGIWNREIFDENFLMLIATIGALIVGEYLEAVAVMLFYQIGEYFQDRAVDKSRKQIADLMNIKSDIAHLNVDGEWKDVNPEDIHIGEVIMIQPGERIPLDGKVVKGNTTLDTSALTGESLPREINVNEFSSDTLMYSLYDDDKLLVEEYLSGGEEVKIFDNIHINLQYQNYHI